MQKMQIELSYQDQLDLEKIGYFAVGFECLLGASSGTVYIGLARLRP